MDIDDLINSFEKCKGAHDPIEEYSNLEYSSRAGIRILAGDYKWILASFVRYERYMNYLSLTGSEDGLTVLFLIQDFLGSRRDSYSIKENSFILAAKIIAIDTLMKNMTIENVRDDASEHSIISNLEYSTNVELFGE